MSIEIQQFLDNFTKIEEEAKREANSLTEKELLVEMGNVDVPYIEGMIKALGNMYILNSKEELFRLFCAKRYLKLKRGVKKYDK